MRNCICTAILVCGLTSAARADSPALALDLPAWAFAVPAERTSDEPSLPVDTFLAELDSAAVEGAIERLVNVGPFDATTVYIGPFEP